jgi:hypothetical protein
MLTTALQDPDGKPLNLLPLLARLKQLFLPLRAKLSREIPTGVSEHVDDCFPLLQRGPPSGRTPQESGRHCSRPFQPWPHRSTIGAYLPAASPGHFAGLAAASTDLSCAPVSRLERSPRARSNSCSFRDASRGRMRFELDVQEQGGLTRMLALFHEELRKQNKRWRDLTPREARQEIARIAEGWTATIAACSTPPSRAVFCPGDRIAAGLC